MVLVKTLHFHFWQALRDLALAADIYPRRLYYKMMQAGLAWHYRQGKQRRASVWHGR